MHRILPIFVLSVCGATLVPMLLILPSIATLQTGSDEKHIRKGTQPRADLTGTAAEIAPVAKEQS